MSLIRQEDLVRKARAQSGGLSRQGQIAAVIIVVIAMVVVLAGVTVNVGEVVALRTAAANAADAGAMAGASWVASGENEMMDIAYAMWMNGIAVNQIFRRPFCPNAGTDPNNPQSDTPRQVLMRLQVVNEALRQIAQSVMSAAWARARIEAFLTAAANAHIDDPTDGAKTQIDAVVQKFMGNNPPNQVHEMITWNRGTAARPQFSTAQIRVHLGGFPMMNMHDNWDLPNVYVLAPCGCYDPAGTRTSCTGGAYYCCNDRGSTSPIQGSGEIPGAAWMGPYPNGLVENVSAVMQSQPARVISRSGTADKRKAWGVLQQDMGPHQDKYAIPRPLQRPDLLNDAGCGCANKAVLNVQSVFPGAWRSTTLPRSLTNADGDVTVTVRRTRGNHNLGFWTARYPDVQASAKAQYRGASVGDLRPIVSGTPMNITQVMTVYRNGRPKLANVSLSQAH